MPSRRNVRRGRATIAAAAIPVSTRPSAPSQTSEWCAATITGVPASRSASRKSVSWKELPPKMSPTASWTSPRRTAAMPLEISGSALAAARNMAPKIAPCGPVAGVDHRHEGADEERERTPRPGGGVEHDEHERLDRDAADQVADGEVE